jgi:hypothetical protein
MKLAVVALLVAAAVAAAAAADAPPLVRYTDGTISFAHPESWRESHPRWLARHGQPLVDLSTQQLGDSCASKTVPGGVEISCGFPLGVLEPGNVFVRWAWAFVGPPLPLCCGPRTIIGDAPAVESVERPGACGRIGGEETVSAVVEEPRLEFVACLRGPDIEQEKADVRQLLASTRFARSAPDGGVVFEGRRFSFVYPSWWHALRPGGRTVAALGDQGLRDPCGAGGRCGWPVRRLGAGGVVAEWLKRRGSAPLASIGGSPTRVGGRLARTAVDRPGACRAIGGDATIQVTLARPAYRFRACLRKPGIARMRAEIRYLLSTTRFHR